ncbi:phosphotransferase enzyme family protein [Bacillus proteolyticus]|uniref:phosphotransferase enzyme family protein n=1 Tax=Bacillus proteolyticus TaxID=2026192 RepID=UPI0030F4A4E5
MMKLSSMLKVVATVDEEWRSSFAENILTNWEHDEGTLYYMRASSNFVFIFQNNGEHFFLRFIEKEEKSKEAIQAEIHILQYLSSCALEVNVPVLSKSQRYIEEIHTELGIFYAVVFKACSGKHYEVADLTKDQFHLWGKQLGLLHAAFKTMPKELVKNRVTWQEHVSFMESSIPQDELVLQKEFERIINWIHTLSTTEENFGVIHYDFELDNLCIDRDNFGIIDFDDCAHYWYVADIAYALRDICNKELELDRPCFEAFLQGYKEETTIDNTILKDIQWFLRMHRLMMFARLTRSVDIPDSEDYPLWLRDLRGKLFYYNEDIKQQVVKHFNR